MPSNNCHFNRQYGGELTYLFRIKKIKIKIKNNNFQIKDVEHLKTAANFWEKSLQN